MGSFYTNVDTLTSDHVLVSEVVDGRKINRRVKGYEPVIFVSARGRDTEWHTIDGKAVEEHQPGNVNACYRFVQENKDVEGMVIHTPPSYNNQYITEHYSENFDINQICVQFLNVETETEYGFPNVEQANEKITLITMKDKRHEESITFGTRPYKGSHEYRLFEREEDMLEEFVQYWRSLQIDIVSGWNINGFDIPYLVNRISKVLGEEHVRKLSPFGIVKRKNSKDEKDMSYLIAGISQLDYLQLYRKYVQKKQESYTLDNIANVVLGERKLENPYETFKEFYQKDWNRFVEYNIRDCFLVDQIDKRMDLMYLHLMKSYKAGINYEDTFSRGRFWDGMIYKYLRQKNIVIPPKNDRNGDVNSSDDMSKDEKFIGAYVKPTITGLHKWVISFDLNSLYPHSIMQYNISPETLSENKYTVKRKELVKFADKIVNQKINTTGVHNENLALTGNGRCYRKDIRGFLPELMEQMYDERVQLKNEMKEALIEYEKDKTKTDLKTKADILHIKERALKIALNSAYGSLRSKFFRYYNVSLVDSITLSCQIAIKWILKGINEYMNEVMRTEDKDYVIAIDTDSFYLDMSDAVERNLPDKSTKEKIDFMDRICKKAIMPFIEREYKKMADYMNAYENKMIMKRESLCDRGLWTANENYILRVHDIEGVRLDEPDIIVKKRIIKSNYPAIARDELKAMIPVILSEDKEEYDRMLVEFKKKFFNSSVEDIATSTGIQFSGYDIADGEPFKKNTPHHVRAAIVYNRKIRQMGLDKKYERIKDNEKIKTVYLQKPNPLDEKAIAFISKLPEEFGVHEYVDRKKQYELVFKEPLKRIVDCLNWQVSNSSNLDKFFSG